MGILKEKNGQYSIRRLPKNAIVSDGGMCKIKGHTFPNIPLKFQVRPRAAHFAKQDYLADNISPTYVVFYADENSAKALFFFRYEQHKERISISICRIVGARIAKHYWASVKFLIKDEKNNILSLNEGEVLRFWYIWLNRH